jgi:hypothetical protein
MAWNSFRKWLGIMAIGAAALLPGKLDAQGYLSVYNYTSDENLYYNSVRFLENEVDGDYLENQSPSLEIYYQDLSNNKHSVAAVDSSISKTYNCPLEGLGDIPDGARNDLAFKFITDFPTNMLIDAKIILGNNTNQISNLVTFCSTNTPDEWGYVHYPLPATSNASNRVYANLQVRFAPLKTISASSAYGQIYINETNSNTNSTSTKVAYGDSLNVRVHPQTNNLTNVRRVVLRKAPKVTGNNYSQP